MGLCLYMLTLRSYLQVNSLLLFTSHNTIAYNKLQQLLQSFYTTTKLFKATLLPLNSIMWRLQEINNKPQKIEGFLVLTLALIRERNVLTVHESNLKKWQYTFLIKSGSDEWTRPLLKSSNMTIAAEWSIIWMFKLITWL